MTNPLTVALTLTPEQLGTIAEHVAKIVLAQLDERGNGSAASSSPYLTVPEAAEILRCPRQRIDDLLSQRRLTRVKEGGRTLLLRDEIETYLDERRC